MPTLPDEARKLYEDAYTKKTYEQYNDPPGMTHGRKKLKALHQDLGFCHLPEHDVESIYWVLFYTLLQAQPCKESPDFDLEAYWQANDIFCNHVIDENRRRDSREELFDYEAPELIEMLDPALASLAQMLVDMSEQIRPEYGHLDPPPAREHLHEAMRRLLLKQIVAMGDEPIKLQPKVPRDLRPVEPPQDKIEGLDLPEGRKRKLEADGSECTKRKKSTTTTLDRNSRPQWQP